jgi:hypothetical protein
VVNVDGGSFQREQVLVTDVFEPVPEPEVLPPAQEEPRLPGAWLLPAAVPVLLLVALAIWWLRQRREPEWEEDWEDDEEEAGIEFEEDFDDDFEDEFDDEPGRGMAFDADDELDEDDYLDEDSYELEDDFDEDVDEEYYGAEGGDPEAGDDDDLPTGIRSTDPDRRD